MTTEIPLMILCAGSIGFILFLAYSGGGDGFLWGEGRGPNNGHLYNADIEAVINRLSPAATEFVLSCSDPSLIIVDAPDATVAEVTKARLLHKQDLTKLGWAVACFLRAKRSASAGAMVNDGEVKT